jgi:phosphoribosylanthranilate isomerase
LRVRVKICGIKSLEDALTCIEAGADALGFVTEYPITVPWNLNKEMSRKLISKLPPFVSTTVVTSGNVSKILEIAKSTVPNVIQLHGEERLDEIEKVVEELSDKGIKVVKALSIDVDTQKAHFEIPEPLEAARSLQDSGIHAIALDSKTNSMPAGTGTTLSWKIAREIREETPLPIILAGGLNQGNVRAAIKFVRPYAVDVITGVEGYPGKKDPNKVRKFIKIVKSWTAEGV